MKDNKVTANLLKVMQRQLEKYETSKFIASSVEISNANRPAADDEQMFKNPNVLFLTLLKNKKRVNK